MNAPSQNVSTAELLIHAATALMRDHGPVGVTFRSVAEAAEVSVATVQHHFGSKEHLLLQLVQSALREDAARLRPYADALPDTSSSNAPVEMENVQAIVRSLVADACGANADRTRARLSALMTATRDGAARVAARRWLSEHRRFFARLLNGLVPRPNHAARYLVELTIGVEVASLGCRRHSLMPLLNDELLRYAVDAALGQGKPACPVAFRANVIALLQQRAAQHTPPASDKSAQARRGILNAAALVMSRGGLAELTHRAVAKEAGIGGSLVSYHFRSIDVLLHAAYRHIHDGFARVAMPARGPAVGPFEAVLAAMLVTRHGGVPAVLGSLEALIASAYDEQFADMAWQTRLMRGVYYLHAPDATTFPLGSGDFFAHMLSIWALGLSLVSHAGWSERRFEACLRSRFSAVEPLFPASTR
ncbi:TetR family transcriptional regulator [Paraburkholderia bryophila]|uniref:TetR/AcrR family transcriptional regulator n=1 Tax=Burkholderiaceae TaxID=119060 RepID=UPI00068EB8CC|nr:TetR family transcriptional regulator [Burkholderia sp. 9120]